MTATIRYRCTLQVTPQCWGDQRKRAKCPGCGGRQTALSGTWGVFTWRGDGRYPAERAHRTYARQDAADAYAKRSSPNYVVRWLPARP